MQNKTETAVATASQSPVVTREQGAWRFGYADARMGNTLVTLKSADAWWRKSYREGHKAGTRDGFGTIPPNRCLYAMSAAVRAQTS